MIFTEGSTATSGADWIRTDLAYEAIRLARMLAALLPDEPEVHGLLALLRAHRRALPGPGRPGRRAGAARGAGPAAVGPLGDPAGSAALAGAEAVGRGLGAYGLQAAIAECHAVGAVGRGDRLGADRAALRGARPAGPLAGRRPQPGGRRRHGPGPGGRAAHRRRAGRVRGARAVAPAARASAASCSPGSAGSTRPAPSSSSPSGCAATSGSRAYSVASARPSADLSNQVPSAAQRRPTPA